MFASVEIHITLILNSNENTLSQNYLHTTKWYVTINANEMTILKLQDRNPKFKVVKLILSVRFIVFMISFLKLKHAFVKIYISDYVKYAANVHLNNEILQIS